MLETYPTVMEKMRTDQDITPEKFLEGMIMNAKMFHGGADYETMIYLLNDYKGKCSQYGVNKSSFLESLELLIVMQFPQENMIE